MNAAQVGGNLEVLKNSGDLEIEHNTVGGNAKIEDNTVPNFASILFNRVNQNLQVYKNTGSGDKRVQENTAGQIVQCFDNAPPFTGGPNTAPKREGQCF